MAADESAFGGLAVGGAVALGELGGADGPGGGVTARDEPLFGGGVTAGGAGGPDVAAGGLAAGGGGALAADGGGMGGGSTIVRGKTSCCAVPSRNFCMRSSHLARLGLMADDGDVGGSGGRMTVAV